MILATSEEFDKDTSTPKGFGMTCMQAVHLDHARRIPPILSTYHSCMPMLASAY